MVMINIAKEFNYKGYACEIKKIDYTDENIERLFSSKDDIDNIMHGGITYEENYKDSKILGFDCNHAFDTDEENTIEFVENNLKEVIDFIEGGKEND